MGEKMEERVNSLTREQWLLRLTELVRPVFEERIECALPKVRVSCGFPSRGGKIKPNGSRVQGECWYASASDDNTIEIFISPVDADTKEVAEILIHELIHAALPEGEGHGKLFRKAAQACGYTGPYRTTPTTPAFWEWISPILSNLPPYPHAKLNARSRAAGTSKPQKNRQLKCECEECGYIARTAKKWIDKVGAPHCPLHGKMAFIS